VTDTISPIEQEPADFRRSMLDVSQAKMSAKAWRAINVLGMSPPEFVVVCIHVDDANMWRELVELMVPDAESEWQRLRDKGDIPMAVGSSKAVVSQIVVAMLPDLAPSLAEPPPEGFARGIALSHSGATVVDLEIHPPQEYV
jgi:hypothetical protein